MKSALTYIRTKDHKDWEQKTKDIHQEIECIVLGVLS